MHKTFLVLSFLLTSIRIFAQDYSLSQGAPAAKNYYEEIPYELINGKMYISGEIAGKKYRFLFDTGAPVILTEDVAAGLGLKDMPKVAIEDAFDLKDSVHVVELNGFKLGNIRFDHIPALRMDHELIKCLNVGGVVGSNLLRHSIVRIDSKSKLVIITDQKDKLDLAQKKSIPMTLSEGQSMPEIKFHFTDSASVVVNFDTGDNSFITINDWLVGKLKPYGLIDSLAVGYGSGALGAFGAQKIDVRKLYAIAPFKVGDAKFSNIKVAGNTSGGLSMGIKLLDYGIITLNYIDSAFYFEGFKKDNDLFSKYSYWTAMYGFLNGKMVVAEVWDKSVGVEQGSLVLAIDDMDCSRASLCDYLNWPDWTVGKDSLLLTVKTKNGEIKKVKIERR